MRGMMLLSKSRIVGTALATIVLIGSAYADITITVGPGANGIPGVSTWHFAESTVPTSVIHGSQSVTGIPIDLTSMHGLMFAKSNGNLCAVLACNTFGLMDIGITIPRQNVNGVATDFGYKALVLSPNTPMPSTQCFNNSNRCWQLVVDSVRNVNGVGVREQETVIFGSLNGTSHIGVQAGTNELITDVFLVSLSGGFENVSTGKIGAIEPITAIGIVDPILPPPLPPPEIPEPSSVLLLGTGLLGLALCSRKLSNMPYLFR